jgi:hypothetical protein
MYENATIFDFNFLPLVEGMPSTLRIWVVLDRNMQTIHIEEHGSIKSLSKIFEFSIEREDVWNFQGFKGRKCVVANNSGHYSFVRFRT